MENIPFEYFSEARKGPAAAYLLSAAVYLSS